MVIFADFRKQGTNETKWGVLDEDNGVYNECYPDDIPMQLLAKIDGGSTEIFITNASLYRIELIKTLWFAGYHKVDGNPTIKQMKNGTFKYLISDTKILYHLTLKVKRKKVCIYNANNLLSLAERRDIIDTWGFAQDAKGYATAVLFSIKAITAGSTPKSRPMTVSACAKKHWINMMGFYYINNALFDCNMNMLEGTKAKETWEKFIRPSYHGGLVLYSEKAGVNTEGGIVVDVNSMYPYVMKNCVFPFGKGHCFTGEPKKKLWRDADNEYVVFYVRFRAKFKLKDGGIPCVSIENTEQALRHEQGWLTTSDFQRWEDKSYRKNPKGVWLTLSNVDFKTFSENYEYKILKWDCGIWFPATRNMFCDYVDYWYNEKKNAFTKGERRIAKMFLNGLSGKMAVKCDLFDDRITIGEDGEVYEDSEKSETHPKSWIHVGSLITAYARRVLISAIKENMDRWMYSDTDCMHLSGFEAPKGIKIDDKELGCWKVERKFKKACYYKRKQYAMELLDGTAKFTIAGKTKTSQRWLESAYNAHGDILSMKGDDRDDYTEEETMNGMQKEAIEALFSGDFSDDDLEVIGDIASNETPEERIVRVLNEDGLIGAYKTPAPQWEYEADFFEERLVKRYKPIAGILPFLLGDAII